MSLEQWILCPSVKQTQIKIRNDTILKTFHYFVLSVNMKHL